MVFGTSTVLPASSTTVCVPSASTASYSAVSEADSFDDAFSLWAHPAKIGVARQPASKIDKYVFFI